VCLLFSAMKDLRPVHEYTLENIHRFRDGEPIFSPVDADVFSRST
jgi:hypothetical protein